MGTAQGFYKIQMGGEAEPRLSAGPRDMLVPMCAVRRISSAECLAPPASAELDGHALDDVAAKIADAWRQSHEAK